MSAPGGPAAPFSEPLAIRYADVPRVIWGDAETGDVADWTYASTNLIHQLVFGLPPGGSFRHSEQLRTIFAADILYHVLQGTLAMSNPETGEVHVVRPGESVFFRRDVWHHGHNFSAEPLRVLEYFSPPPAQGTSRKYARTRQMLTDVKTVRDELLGDWPPGISGPRPAGSAAAEQPATLRVIRDGDALCRLEGSRQQLLVELFVSTDLLTAGRLTLLPHRRSEPRRYGGDLSLLVAEGRLFVRAGHEGSQTVSEIGPQDGFFLPAGMPAEFHNIGGGPARCLFGVAPRYLPAD